MFKSLSACFTLIWFYHSTTAVFSAVVHIDGGGILGDLDLNAVSQSTVNFRFRRLESFHRDVRVDDLTLAIHELPPVYKGTCGEEEVGPIYDPTDAYRHDDYNSTCRHNKVNCAVGDLRNRLGTLGDPSLGANTTFPNDISLFSGPRSILGRALVVYDRLGQPLTCAVVRNQTVDNLSLRETVLEARFPAPVAGVVTFRQVLDDRTSARYDTQILVDLFSNDGSPTAANSSWYLVLGQATDPSSCSRLAANPIKRTCKEDRCFTIYLVEKHGHLTVPQGRGRRYFFTDSNLPLDDITEMSLVVAHPQSDRYACAALRPQLGVVARFDGDVKGHISILPQVVGSLLQVNLTGLAGKAGGYHVHQFPVANGSCSTTGGHFNPFNIQYQSNAMNGSSDQFEVGDLSGLFGSLERDEAVFTTFSRNLLSEGLHGILGRSIVIHHKDQSRWQCATLEPLPPHGQAVTKYTAEARFDGNYEGYVKLTQYEIGEKVYTGTVVEIDIRKEGNASFDHKWHVHETPAAAYEGIAEGNCASQYAGGHYNPEGVDLSIRYSDECQPENQFRCELGDMSGKHGKYTINTLDSAAGRKLMYDTSLPLIGKNGVIRRSVVIHAANGGGPRIACATLYPGGTRALSFTFRKPAVLDEDDIRRTIAKSLSRPNSDVQHLYLSVDDTTDCVCATFAVPAAVVKQLKGVNFASYLKHRGDVCGKYIVETECQNRPNVDKDALAVVHINGNGITGELDIDGMLDGNVSFRFRSLKAFGRSRVDDVAVAVHTLPPLYRGRCTEAELGPVYDPTRATVSSDYETRCRSSPSDCAVGDLRWRLGTLGAGKRMTTAFPQKQNFLKGPSSMIGRSLVVYNVTTGAPITCSVIHRRHVGTTESMREISLEAKLLAPIAGKITMSQEINDVTGDTYETRILVSVFSNDVSVPIGLYKWHLTKDKLQNIDECHQLAKKSRTASCTGKDCHFTDLTGKHGHLNVPWGRGDRVLYTDINLPLRNITDMTLIVSDDKKSNVSCASIDLRVGTRAHFTGEVKGTITCIPTHGGSSVDVDLSNLQRLAGGYHVHRYPVTNGDCHSTGGHLNPFNVTRSPPTGHGSDDQFEVGDLSGIFGSLVGRYSVSFHRFAPNVYCERILGRSIVIHFANGSRWQCASLEPVLTDGRTQTEWKKHSAVAHFSGHYEGYVQLTQWERADAHFFTDTVVDVNIHANGNMSTGHKFHIHQKPIAGFNEMLEKNCHANFTGGHYNPFGIDLKTGYSDECNAQSQLRCEVGDLSSKHGLYAFYSKGQNGRRLTSDGFLPLAGENSVMLRSVVFHAAEQGAARVACATIYPEGHKPFSVTFSKPARIDLSDIRLSIAHGLEVSPTEVRYLDLDVDHSGQCVSVTFALQDSVANSLNGNDFLSSLKSNGTFGNYKVKSDCLSTVSFEVASAVPPAVLSVWAMIAAVLLSIYLSQ